MNAKRVLAEKCREAYHAGNPLSIQEIVNLADQLYTAEQIELKEKLEDIHNTLCGQNLKVANWHLNGDLEPLDNFFTKNGW